jgi:hypothetical protein
MAEIGSRGSEILALLSEGPHSLAALIARVDPDRPSMVMACLKRLQERGAITISGKTSRKRTEGVLVALAAQPPRPAEAARRSASTAEAVAHFEALLRTF